MSALTIRRRSASSLPLVLGVVVIAVVMAVLVKSIAHTLKHVKPVKAKKPPVSAVVWGDRVFVGPGGLAHWLKVRGVGYSVWADRHPPANHLLQKKVARLERKK
jgi:hypothetical protein